MFFFSIEMSIDYALLEEECLGEEEEGAGPALAPPPFPYYPEAYARAWVDLAARRAAVEPSAPAPRPGAPVRGRGHDRRRGRGHRDYRANVSSQS